MMTRHSNSHHLVQRIGVVAIAVTILSIGSMGAAHAVTRSTLSVNVFTGATAHDTTGGNVTGTSGGSPTPGPINCGTSCAETVDTGTVVTLTAAPNTGYDFVNWTGACTGSATSCNVTLNVNKTVKAHFKIHPTLKVAIKLHGSVTSSPSGISCSSGICSAPFALGTTITLTATPTFGYAFVKWGGSCVGTVPTCIVTLTGSKSLTAFFN